MPTIANGFAVATANYRLVTSVTYAAPMVTSMGRYHNVS
jgi:hypothetical protein